jgi:hypothetical protein
MAASREAAEAATDSSACGQPGCWNIAILRTLSLSTSCSWSRMRQLKLLLTYSCCFRKALLMRSTLGVRCSHNLAERHGQLGTPYCCWRRIHDYHATGNLGHRNHCCLDQTECASSYRVEFNKSFSVFLRTQYGQVRCTHYVGVA